MDKYANLPPTSFYTKVSFIYLPPTLIFIALELGTDWYFMSFAYLLYFSIENCDYF